jgi:hypothetical protein
MARSVILWVIAIVITVASAAYQRVTGPAYPLGGEAFLGETSVYYKLERSHGGDDDHRVAIKSADQSIDGVLSYKRYKTDEDWTDLPMNREEEYLVGHLPHQPPAGKLQYWVKLTQGSDEVTLPEAGSVVIRFKGAVPPWALMPHIVFMFLAMLVSTRAGLQAVVRSKNLKKYTVWSIGLLLLGGLIFGPLVQKFAFGEYWTGVPLGIDLTDNKTLIAFVGWLVATVAVFKSRSPRAFVLGASILMLGIFLIPHSVFGSELDYSEMETMKMSFSLMQTYRFLV